MYCICEGIYNTRTHDPESFDWTESQYKILRCPSCRQILILRYVTGGNDITDENSEQKPYVEYSRQVLFSPAKQRHYSIPAPIADVLEQAEKVVPTSPRAAIILCRAALEEICREHNIPENKVNSDGVVERLDLKKRMNILLEREKLTKDLREIMHGIRDIGNEFAHRSQVFLATNISQNEVELLIDLVDYVLNRLYVEKIQSVEAVKGLNILKEKILNKPKSDERK